jgi:hypothetical protein
VIDYTSRGRNRASSGVVIKVIAIAMSTSIV